MLEKYKNRLNWSDLSRTRQMSLLSQDAVEKFKEL